MAWEWVAPTATGAVGTAGIVFTWLSGMQGREHAEILARQQRLAETYVLLLDMGERTGQWAQVVLPIMDTVPPQPVPEIPNRTEQAAVNARIGAFGSEAVRNLMGDWRDIVREMISLVGIIEFERREAQKYGRDHDTSKHHEKLQLDLRPKEAGARRAMADQVALELGHRPSPSPPHGDDGKE